MNEKIAQLKKEKNAVILAHYYVPDSVQALADYVGDSFYLAKAAKKTSSDIIVFCGVSFMGESAKILNPEKRVLMPDVSADCPMAHMATAEKIGEMRSRYSDLAVVCYINSTADLKALSDVCVTSSNAVKIVKALPNKNIFFIPDKNLGRFVAEKVPEKNIIINDGYCPIHASITVSQVKQAMQNHPNALVLSHPECEKAVLEISDFIGSTAELIDYASESTAEEFIVCTEDGVDYRLKNISHEKRFYFPEKRPCCADMKLNTPEKLLHVLETEENEIKMSEELRKAALIPLERMLEYAK